jgi:hypothetical protein
MEAERDYSRRILDTVAALHRDEKSLGVRVPSLAFWKQKPTPNIGFRQRQSDGS